MKVRKKVEIARFSIKMKSIFFGKTENFGRFEVDFLSGLNVSFQDSSGVFRDKRTSLGTMQRSWIADNSSVGGSGAEGRSQGMFQNMIDGPCPRRLFSSISQSFSLVAFEQRRIFKEKDFR